MSRAYAMAQAAFTAGEVPVGAVLVAPDGKTILAEAHNAPLAKCDPTAHAEIEVLRAAAQKTGNYRLSDCTLYVTLEPCTMCAGAISNARISHLVFGASDEKGGAVQNGIRFFEQKTCHSAPKVTAGILALECGELLREFFKARRQQNRKSPL
ncbi:MAG: tRNA-specific adenosine deaminase [Robiginitomaculum sp.]|nr:MAG: tRNA-specific adenosine deaminase [Robiginitomaculum sp.]